MIDDTDKINSSQAIKVLMSIYPHCSNQLQFKLIVNLITLSHGYSSNQKTLAYIDGFFDWITNNLLSLQFEFNKDSNQQKKFSHDIWITTSKLYINQVKELFKEQNKVWQLLDQLQEFIYLKVEETIDNSKKEEVVLAFRYL